MNPHAKHHQKLAMIGITLFSTFFTFSYMTQTVYSYQDRGFNSNAKSKLTITSETMTVKKDGSYVVLNGGVKVQYDQTEILTDRLFYHFENRRPKVAEFLGNVKLTNCNTNITGAKAISTNLGNSIEFWNDVKVSIAGKTKHYDHYIHSIKSCNKRSWSVSNAFVPYKIQNLQTY